MLLVHKAQSNELTSCHRTIQVFTPREPTIGSHKKQDRNEEQIMTTSCSVFPEHSRAVNFGNEENEANVNCSEDKKLTVRISIPELIFVTPADGCEDFDGERTT